MPPDVILVEAEPMIKLEIVQSAKNCATLVSIACVTNACLFCGL